MISTASPVQATAGRTVMHPRATSSRRDRATASACRAPALEQQPLDRPDHAARGRRPARRLEGLDVVDVGEPDDPARGLGGGEAEGVAADAVEPAFRKASVKPRSIDPLGPQRAQFGLEAVPGRTSSVATQRPWSVAAERGSRAMVTMKFAHSRPRSKPTGP